MVNAEYEETKFKIRYNLPSIYKENADEIFKMADKYREIAEIMERTPGRYLPDEALYKIRKIVEE